MKLKFMSSTDSNEKLTMHTKTDSKDNMIGKGKGKIIEKTSSFVFAQVSDRSGDIHKGSNFLFDYINGLH